MGFSQWAQACRQLLTAEPTAIATEQQGFGSQFGSAESQGGRGFRELLSPYLKDFDGF